MRIKNKYKVGQLVWYILHNRVSCSKILMIRIYVVYNGVDLNYVCEDQRTEFYEHKLFESREKLVESLR